MVTKHQIFAMHDRFPTWTARQIADALGCRAEWVHTVKRRYDVPIPAGRRGRRPSASPLAPAAKTRRIAEMALADPPVGPEAETESAAKATFGRTTVSVSPDGDVVLIRAGILGRGGQRSSHMWDREQIEAAAAAASQRQGQDAKDELSALRWAMERLRHG